jgi:hypothetical protein
LFGLYEVEISLVLIEERILDDALLVIGNGTNDSGTSRHHSFASLLGLLLNFFKRFASEVFVQ